MQISFASILKNGRCQPGPRVLDRCPSCQLSARSVSARSAGEATAEDLDAYCRQNLAAYKVPRVIEFMDKVLKTASGKTLRFLFRQGPG
jgi:acyl-CoA synthetase (AMP-forming)/AMP-acid ligase II